MAERIPAILWTLLALYGVAAQAVNARWAKFTIATFRAGGTASDPSGRAIQGVVARAHLQVQVIRLIVVVGNSAIGLLVLLAPPPPPVHQTIMQTAVGFAFLAILLVNEVGLNGIATLEIRARLRLGGHLWPRRD